MVGREPVSHAQSTIVISIDDVAKRTREKIGEGADHERRKRSRIVTDLRR
jgi:hypothetical protein